MPLQNVHQGRSGLGLGVFLSISVWVATPIVAQELPLQRDYPRAGPFVCPAPVVPVDPTPQARSQAGQLASDANEALNLGDFESARELLAQATNADGTSPELAYQHARALQVLEFSDEAILEYCRALSLGALAAGIDDGRARLDALYEIVRDRISERAREAFVLGLSQADLGLYTEAVDAFSVSIQEAPDWAAAAINRAIVLEELGRIQESIADYRRYLELTPSDLDPLGAGALERIGMLEGEAARPTPSPGRALTLGVLVPGLGQYYSGRGMAGAAVLSLTVVAVATGVMVKEITVRCLDPFGPGPNCPPEQLVDESTKRPYLVPALGAAAAVTDVTP